jgi:hypothetical protein
VASNVRAIKVHSNRQKQSADLPVDSHLIDIHGRGPKVLDPVIRIKSHIDPTLPFRRSCAKSIDRTKSPAVETPDEAVAPASEPLHLEPLIPPKAGGIESKEIAREARVH